MTSAETRAACLDTETLAAWMDGGLSGHDLASAEAHAATCARCQAMLAAMAKSAPVPVQAETSWRRFLVPALVPLTAATVAAIWLALPPERAESPASIAPSIASSSPDRERAEAPTPPNEQKDALAQRQRSDTRAPEAVHSKPEESRPQSSPRRSLAYSAQSQPATPPEPPPPAAAPAVAANASRAPVPSTEQYAEVERKEVAAVAGPAQAKAGGSAALDMIAPEPPRGWRLNNDRVERSTDGGATWSVQYEEDDAGLIALSSPAPGVCWVVGRAGTVLLTTDGRTWRRLTFPKTSDLASVLASDAQNAVVFTAEGTVYVTKNGGQSWEIPRR